MGWASPMVDVHGDEIALMPCPFCGEEELLSIEETRPPDEGLHVECELCKARGPLCESMFNAAMTWNERSSQQHNSAPEEP
jgi:Lar family restriction alleviation protein